MVLVLWQGDNICACDFCELTPLPLVFWNLISKQECTSICSPFNMCLTAHITNNIISIKMQLSKHWACAAPLLMGEASVLMSMRLADHRKISRPFKTNFVVVIHVQKCLLQLSPGKRERVAFYYLEGLFERGKPISLQITLDFCATVAPLNNQDSHNKETRGEQKLFHLDHTFSKGLSCTYLAQCTVMHR